MKVKIYSTKIHDFNFLNKISFSLLRLIEIVKLQKHENSKTYSGDKNNIIDIMFPEK